MHYYISQKIILGLLIIASFIIGLLSTIKRAPAPQIFSQNTAFFLIDINRANAEELRLLPYVSADMAQEIIRYRTEKGCFKSIDELSEIKGIGLARLKKMRKYLKKII
ncbi:MAG: helix-hairpin-helix domain-containing protein [Planctomycetota bacterium]|mgnify:CR=1 FL=1